MTNYPIKIWMVAENEFDQFILTGGKIIYIVDEPGVRFNQHPAITTAGILLPPVDAIQAELDGNISVAETIYSQYLLNSEANIYINILLTAAIQQVPIGIMFGRDELNMQFPKMFIDFLYRNYGLVIGVANKLAPYIEVGYMPVVLGLLYMSDMIDYKTFMEKHPPLPIIGTMVVSKMAVDVNPPVSEKTFEGYYKYFEFIKDSTIKNGGNLPICPVVFI